MNKVQVCQIQDDAVFKRQFVPMHDIGPTITIESFRLVNPNFGSQIIFAVDCSSCAPSKAQTSFFTANGFESIERQKCA